MRNTPAPADFVRRLAPALRQAASIAHALEGRVANRPKTGEATPIKAALTIADSAAQEALLVPLLEHFPQVCLEAEEDTPSVHHFPGQAEARVVVDPIDGTLRFYLERRGPYGVMVGMAVEREYVAALVAIPREGYFLDAIRGAGARFSTRAQPIMQPAHPEADGPRVLVSHDLPDETLEVLRSADLEAVPASGGAISVAPLLPDVCAGLRLVRGDPRGVSVRGRIGALISQEAGAVVCCETGEPFPSDIEAPARALLVAADSAGMAILERAVAAAG